MATAIIVAAGKGVRMGGTVRKQYLVLDGLPILSHTLKVFDDCPDIGNLYIVTPEDEFDFCRTRVVSPIALGTPFSLVPGGERRQDSVWNGLMAIGESKDVVVIHDGVRPFVTTSQLSSCIESARTTGASILGIPATDTLKEVSDAGIIRETVDRRGIWLAQTPQAFRYDLIRNAHEYMREEGITGTDDAMAMESMGEPVAVIPGSRHNIKITTPEDLLLARVLRRLMSESGSGTVPT